MQEVLLEEERVAPSRQKIPLICFHNSALSQLLEFVYIRIRTTFHLFGPQKQKIMVGF